MSRNAHVRFSHLKLFAASARHYLAATERDEWTQSAAMRRGSAVHALVFGKPLHVWEGDRRGKGWKQFEAAHAGELIVTSSEVAVAEEMAAKVAAHPIAGGLLQVATTYEQRIEWTRAGRQCAGTPDAFGRGVLLDIKTTKCAEPMRFIRDAQFRGYHAQLSWYAQGLRANGIETERHIIVAVESIPPYEVVVIELTPGAVLAGEALVGMWWEQLRQCEQTGNWPGYTDAIVRFDIEDAMTNVVIGGEEFEF